MLACLPARDRDRMVRISNLTSGGRRSQSRQRRSVGSQCNFIKTTTLMLTVPREHETDAALSPTEKILEVVEMSRRGA